MKLSNHNFHVSRFIVAVLLFEVIFLPHAGNAGLVRESMPMVVAGWQYPHAEVIVLDEPQVAQALPENEEVPVRARRRVVITAYSSTPDQTDDTPFITANGTRVRDGIIAANFLRFNTRVRIPELYGEKTFIVTDRMHARFSDRVDIWMETREEAVQFGMKVAIIEVY